MSTARRHRLVETFCRISIFALVVVFLAAASAIYGGPA